MKKLNLKITKPYKDINSFDSKRVKCVGLIKDMVVSLAQIPARSLVMDVVVVDIPACFWMLLSRSPRDNLGDVLKLDFTYAIIPVLEVKREYYTGKPGLLKPLLRRVQVILLCTFRKKTCFPILCCKKLQKLLKIQKYISLKKLKVRS